MVYMLLIKPLIKVANAEKSKSELLGRLDINWMVICQLPHKVTNVKSWTVSIQILHNIPYLSN